MTPLRDYIAVQDRGKIPYVPGEKSINVVLVILSEACGVEDATPFEINGAYIDLGAKPCSCGDVAEHVLQRREPQTTRSDGWTGTLFA